MRAVTSVCLIVFCAMFLCFGASAQEKQNKPVTPKKPAAVKPTPGPGRAVQKPAAKGVETKAKAKGEEYYHALTTDLENAGEHSRMLYHQASSKTQSEMNMTVAKQHIDAIGASLDQAKKNLAQIEQNMSAAEKEEVKDIVTDMHASLAKAQDAYAKLKAEVSAPKPNPATIKQQAAAVHHESTKAMGRHREMKTKYSIQEPPAPVWPQPQE
jgi:hypothetical protein